jgi:hypothetical protein
MFLEVHSWDASTKQAPKADPIEQALLNTLNWTSKNALFLLHTWNRKTALFLVHTRDKPLVYSPPYTPTLLPSPFLLPSIPVVPGNPGSAMNGKGWKRGKSLKPATPTLASVT